MYSIACLYLTTLCGEGVGFLLVFVDNFLLGAGLTPLIYLAICLSKCLTFREYPQASNKFPGSILSS